MSSLFNIICCCVKRSKDKDDCTYTLVDGKKILENDCARKRLVEGKVEKRKPNTFRQESLIRIKNIMDSDPVLRDRVLDAFETFDLNGDGLISRDELEEVLKKTNQFVSKEDTNAMFDSADLDGDGQINVHEFCKLINQ